MIGESIAIVFCIAWVIVWIMTGRSPFWWWAMAFLFAEAVRHTAWECVVPAAQEFSRRVRIRFAAVRLEVSA